LRSELEKLLDLQGIDTQLDQARHRLEHLPERELIASLDRQSSETNRGMLAAEAAAAEIGTRQASTEAELAHTEERIAAIDRRLYSGEINATKDLQAMSSELTHLRSRASSLEDEVLGLLEEREPFDADVIRLQSDLVELAGNREETAGKLEAAASAVEASIAELRSARAAAAADVPAELLTTYERLRSRLGGIGVARLVGNHCDGCHLTLSAMELDRVKHLPDGEVYTCEQCSRILVP
jgi:predicted  nucleic acid-binding Zn-ribbon protein